MHRVSLLRGLAIWIAALWPLSPLAVNAALWLSWMDFRFSDWIGYCRGSSGFRWSIKFIWLCAFLCMGVAAQVQAAFTDQRQGAFC
jgi:hypothetical protein